MSVMGEIVVIDTRIAAATSGVTVGVRTHDGAVTVPTAAGFPRRVPTMIPRSQAYYWSRAWQAEEAEALDDLRTGRSRVFDDPGDLARYLLGAGE